MAITLEEKEKVLVLRRGKNEPSKNSTSSLTSQEKAKSWRWPRPEQQAGDEPSFHFAHASAVKAPSWFPGILRGDRVAAPTPTSALSVTWSESIREKAWVWAGHGLHEDLKTVILTPWLWWELGLTMMLFLLWIPKALKSGVNDLPVSCCILLIDFFKVFFSQNLPLSHILLTFLLTF